MSVDSLTSSLGTLSIENTSELQKPSLDENLTSKDFIGRGPVGGVPVLDAGIHVYQDYYQAPVQSARKYVRPSNNNQTSNSFMDDIAEFGEIFNQYQTGDIPSAPQPVNRYIPQITDEKLMSIHFRSRSPIEHLFNQQTNGTILPEVKNSSLPVLDADLIEEELSNKTVMSSSSSSISTSGIHKPSYANSTMTSIAGVPGGMATSYQNSYEFYNGRQVSENIPGNASHQLPVNQPRPNSVLSENSESAVCFQFEGMLNQLSPKSEVLEQSSSVRSSPPGNVYPPSVETLPYNTTRVFNHLDRNTDGLVRENGQPALFENGHQRHMVGLTTSRMAVNNTNGQALLATSQNPGLGYSHTPGLNQPPTIPPRCSTGTYALNKQSMSTPVVGNSKRPLQESGEVCPPNFNNFNGMISAPNNQLNSASQIENNLPMNGTGTFHTPYKTHSNGGYMQMAAQNSMCDNYIKPQMRPPVENLRMHQQQFQTYNPEYPGHQILHGSPATRSSFQNTQFDRNLMYNHSNGHLNQANGYLPQNSPPMSEGNGVFSQHSPRNPPMSEGNGVYSQPSPRNEYNGSPGLQNVNTLQNVPPRTVSAAATAVGQNNWSPPQDWSNRFSPERTPNGLQQCQAPADKTMPHNGEFHPSPFQQPQAVFLPPNVTIPSGLSQSNQLSNVVLVIQQAPAKPVSSDVKKERPILPKPSPPQFAGQMPLDSGALSFTAGNRVGDGAKAPAKPARKGKRSTGKFYFTCLA